MFRTSICEECNNTIKYHHRRKYCKEPCAKVVDNRKRQERRTFNKAPDQMAKLLAKVSQGDDGAIEKLSILQERVDKIKRQKQRELHITKLKMNLEQIQDLRLRGYTSFIPAHKREYHRYLPPVDITDKSSRNPEIDLLLLTEKDLKRRLEIATEDPEKREWKGGQLVNTTIQFDGIDPDVYKYLKNRKSKKS